MTSLVGNLGSAFGPTTGKDITAIRSGHSGTEARSMSVLNFGRLIRFYVHSIFPPRFTCVRSDYNFLPLRTQLKTALERWFGAFVRLNAGLLGSNDRGFMSLLLSKNKVLFFTNIPKSTEFLLSFLPWFVIVDAKWGGVFCNIRGGWSWCWRLALASLSRHLWKTALLKMPHHLQNPSPH